MYYKIALHFAGVALFLRLLLVTRVITAQSIAIKENKSDHVTISTNPFHNVRRLAFAPLSVPWLSMLYCRGYRTPRNRGTILQIN